MSLRERARSCKTLICLLQALSGKTTTVELRNECAITGKVDSVDGYMNIDMTDVTFTGPSGECQQFSSFFVQGKQVRYVHIPDDVNVTEAIKFQLGILKERRVNYENKKTSELLLQTRALREQIIRNKAKK